MLHESFGYVQAIGGHRWAVCLGFEYCLESESSRCYRLLWTNRLAAETRSGRLVRHEGGTIRSGPASETISAVTDAVPELRHFRQRQSRSKKKAA